MATINPPWRFDPLQMPVNVSWGSDYLLYIQFSWADKVLQSFTNTPIAGAGEMETLVTSDVRITNNAPSGMLVSDVTASVVGGFGARFYTRYMVFDVGSLPQFPHDFTINFEITEQDDDSSDYIFGTDSGGSGVTSVGAVFGDGGPTQRVIDGPWASTLTSLYRKSAYHVDNSQPPGNVIQPNNPGVSPGAAASLNIATSGVNTIANSDIFYHPPVPPPIIVGGGEYSIVGFLHGGALALSMANMPLVNTSAQVPVVWPSAPNFFTIDSVTGTNPPSAPPPPYTAGVYSVSPDPNADLSGDPGQYLSGEAPLTTNYYTGTFPIGPP